jgi:predicted nucleic acid-binding protein
MIVVSNTSPVTNLSAVGQLDLLPRLFGEMHLPRAVEEELSAGGTQWPGAVEVERAAWVKRHRVQDEWVVDALRLDLDRGEAETIALALQLQADLVLLDEQMGRLAARHFGLKVMGVVGILLRAKELGLVPEVRTLLDGLRQKAGFYLSQPVYDHALDVAGES